MEITENIETETQEKKESPRNDAFFTVLALAVTILIPVPGRFAYGIIMLLLFNFIVLFGTLFTYAITKLDMEALKTPILTIFLLCVSILYKATLTYISPISALSLGFVIYLPAASTSIFAHFFDHPEADLKSNILKNMTRSLGFTIFSLVIFLFRDVFGYGTITLPSKNGFLTIKTLFSDSDFSAASFVATIPGAFIIVSLLFAVLVFLMNKIHNTKRIGK